MAGGETTLYVIDGKIVGVEEGIRGGRSLEGGDGGQNDGCGEGTSGQAAGGSSASGGGRGGCVVQDHILDVGDIPPVRGWMVDDWGYLVQLSTDDEDDLSDLDRPDCG